MNISLSFKRLFFQLVTSERFLVEPSEDLNPNDPWVGYVCFFVVLVVINHVFPRWARSRGHLPCLWTTSSPGSLRSNMEAAGSSGAPFSSPSRRLRLSPNLNKLRGWASGVSLRCDPQVCPQLPLAPIGRRAHRLSDPRRPLVHTRSGRGLLPTWKYPDAPVCVKTGGTG